LRHLTVIKPSHWVKAFGFASLECPSAIYGESPFSTDLLPLILWATCSSTEISFKKGNFCVLVKCRSGFETPGINAAVGLVSVPGEESSFSVACSLFLYTNKFQIVQSDVTLFSVVRGYHIITKHFREGFGQRLPACNPCTCTLRQKQQKGWAGFLMPQNSRPKGISICSIYSGHRKLIFYFERFEILRIWILFCVSSASFL